MNDEIDDYVETEPSKPLKCGLDEVKKISFWRLLGIKDKIHWKFSAGNRVTLASGILKVEEDMETLNPRSLEKLLLRNK